MARGLISKEEGGGDDVVKTVTCKRDAMVEYFCYYTPFFIYNTSTPIQ